MDCDWIRINRSSEDGQESRDRDPKNETDRRSKMKDRLWPSRSPLKRTKERVTKSPTQKQNGVVGERREKDAGNCSGAGQSYIHSILTPSPGESTPSFPINDFLQGHFARLHSDTNGHLHFDTNRIRVSADYAGDLMHSCSINKLEHSDRSSVSSIEPGPSLANWRETFRSCGSCGLAKSHKLNL